MQERSAKVRAPGNCQCAGKLQLAGMSPQPGLTAALPSRRCKQGSTAASALPLAETQTLWQRRSHSLVAKRLRPVKNCSSNAGYGRAPGESRNRPAFLRAGCV